MQQSQIVRTVHPRSAGKPRTKCRDPCDDPVARTAQKSDKSAERFSDESMKKLDLLNSIKNCRRIRLTDPKYKDFGYGKIIIATPDQMLMWFPDVHSHLCFTKEPI